MYIFFYRMSLTVLSHYKIGESWHFEIKQKEKDLLYSSYFFLNVCTFFFPEAIITFPSKNTENTFLGGNTKKSNPRKIIFIDPRLSENNYSFGVCTKEFLLSKIWQKWFHFFPSHDVQVKQKRITMFFFCCSWINPDTKIFIVRCNKMFPRKNKWKKLNGRCKQKIVAWHGSKLSFLEILKNAK